MVRDARQLAYQHPNILAALWRLDVEELLHRQHKGNVVDKRRDIVQPVRVWDYLGVSVALGLFLEGSVQVANLRIAVDNRLAIQLQRHVNDTVHRRVARPHMQEHVARFAAVVPLVHVESRVLGIVV